jgi:hypothetical protein
MSESNRFGSLTLEPKHNMDAHRVSDWLLQQIIRRVLIAEVSTSERSSDISKV